MALRASLGRWQALRLVRGFGGVAMWAHIVVLVRRPWAALRLCQLGRMGADVGGSRIGGASSHRGVLRARRLERTSLPLGPLLRPLGNLRKKTRQSSETIKRDDVGHGKAEVEGVAVPEPLRVAVDGEAGILILTSY